MSLYFHTVESQDKEVESFGNSPCERIGHSLIANVERFVRGTAPIDIPKPISPTRASTVVC